MTSEQRYDPVTTTTPALARRDLTAYLHERSRDDLVPTATLLLSELVTNSLLYADGPIVVRADVFDHTLTVHVDDECATLPRPRRPDTNGRGLHIVDAIAADWGATPLPRGGKSTWFTLRAPRN